MVGKIGPCIRRGFLLRLVRGLPLRPGRWVVGDFVDSIGVSLASKFFLYNQYSLLYIPQFYLCLSYALCSATTQGARICEAMYSEELIPSTSPPITFCPVNLPSLIKLATLIPLINACTPGSLLFQYPPFQLHFQKSMVGVAF